MTKKATVLHITAHLGGGVGRALSTLAAKHKEQGEPFEHVFACLERPHDAQFADRLRDVGFAVRAPVGGAELEALAARADIVQVEWWHHPRLLGWLTGHAGLRSRLILWAHTSGLHVPALPGELVTLPHAFLFSTPASLLEHSFSGQNTIRVVHSSGGFDDMRPPIRGAPNARLRFGYLGAFNPAKLHPRFLDFLAAVEGPSFLLHCYGDTSPAPAIRTAAATGAPLRLHGPTDRPGLALHRLDVLLYLLNPQHYGTTENALLEAMACGVVPIVMDNPVERSIVQHGETGWVIDSPRALAETIRHIARHPEERIRMGEAASRHVREKFSANKTASALSECYAKTLNLAKRVHDFQRVFGKTPAEWFVAGLGRYGPLLELGSTPEACTARRRHAFLYEETKGSAFHFHRSYPGDPDLRRWARMLEADLATVAAA